MQVIKNDDRLHFETVLIPDGEFEVLYPQSPSSSRMKILERSDIYYNESSITDSTEELIVPSHNLFTNEILEESNIVDKLEAHGSTVKLNGSTKNQDCVWENKKPFRVIRAQSNCVLQDEAIRGSPRISSLISHGDKKKPKLISSGSTSLISKDPLLKSKMTVLKLQQKEKYLEETLNKINGVISGMKEVVSKTVSSDNYKVKSCINGSISNLSLPKNSKGPQKKTQSAEESRSPKRGKDLNKTPSLHSSDESKECNIDFLKGCIIDASRTLIKTEKSLRVLGKLLHSEVVIEKHAAVNHLKNFQCTVNTFRKTINGIDESLLTCYRHLIPNNITEPKCGSVSSSRNQDSQKSEDNMIDYGNLLGDKRFEIIVPAVATKRVIEISGNSTGEQNDNSNLKSCYPDDEQIDFSNQRLCYPDDQQIDFSNQRSCYPDGEQNDISRLRLCYPNVKFVQSESEKRRKGNNDCPPSKKIKTRIINHNWSSRLERN